MLGSILAGFGKGFGAQGCFCLSIPMDLTLTAEVSVLSGHYQSPPRQVSFFPASDPLRRSSHIFSFSGGGGGGVFCGLPSRGLI